MPQPKCRPAASTTKGLNMKCKLEIIIMLAKEIAELAECDIGCFGDDFCATDYTRRADEIKRLAVEFESLLKKK